MSLQSGRGRLAGLARELNRAWDETGEHWRDRKAGEFDQHYLRDLFDGVDNAVAAMEELDKVLKKLRQDCEFE